MCIRTASAIAETTRRTRIAFVVLTAWTCSCGGTSDDTPACSNGVVDQGEECDGDDLGGRGCVDLGYPGGELRCSGQCTYVLDGCLGVTPACRNGYVDEDEECDGDDLDGQDCVGLGFVGGELSCDDDCRYDPSGCEAWENVYYVRPDGGDADQCTGLADAGYPGSGTALPCAWSHPFVALPPNGEPRIAGGDTLVVARGSYMMGIGAPAIEGCDEVGPWGCHMSSVPGGPDADHPTRIVGQGCDAGCDDPPELWGTERAETIFDLDGSDNVVIAGLELTDHSSCVESHGHGLGGTELTCERDEEPYGEWAVRGIFARDSRNVTLRHLDIHGFAVGGVLAGRLEDWTLEDVRIAGNGWVGWDGDLTEDAGSSNSGTLTFRRVAIEWNGCAETYPEGAPTGCWAQTAGGYGDGLGTALTGGHWAFEDCRIMHNTSDGLDLLYLQAGGTSVTLDRVRVEGNAGNQVKFVGPATITNSIIVGNCDFFEGQDFTLDVDPCRAGGDALVAIFLGSGDEEVTVTNTAFFGVAGLLFAGPMNEVEPPHSCAGTERIVGWNNLFLGGPSFFDPGSPVALFYQEGCDPLRLETVHSLAWNVRAHDAPDRLDPVFPSDHNWFEEPGLEGPLSGLEYGMVPAAGSSLIDRGDGDHCPAVDYRGAPRPAGSGCDIGPYEVE